MDEIEIGHIAKIKFSTSSIRSHEVACVVKRVEYDRIALVYPEERKELAKYLQEGREIEVVIYSDKGIYAFDSIVIDSPYSYDFVVEYPEERTKIQRREYLRVPVQLELLLNKGEQKIKTSTVNIGGGGIRFNMDLELKRGSVWSFKLYLPEWREPIKGNGEILYTVKQEDEMFSVIKFIDISESDRNKIIKLCFDEESSRLRVRSGIKKW